MVGRYPLSRWDYRSGRFSHKRGRVATPCKGFRFFVFRRQLFFVFLSLCRFRKSFSVSFLLFSLRFFLAISGTYLHRRNCGWEQSSSRRLPVSNCYNSDFYTFPIVHPDTFLLFVTLLRQLVFFNYKFSPGAGSRNIHFLEYLEPSSPTIFGIDTYYFRVLHYIFSPTKNSFSAW